MVKLPGIPEEAEDTLPRRPRGRPKLEDVAAIEQKLLAAALAEFNGRGYGAASMTAIAKAASVSKTTLYARFPSKERLFQSIIRDQARRARGLGGVSRSSARSGLIEGLRRHADHLISEYLRADVVETRWLILTESRRFPQLGEVAVASAASVVDELADFIRECAIVDGVPCRDPRKVANLYSLAIRGWLINSMLSNRKPRPSERKAWIEDAVDVLVSGRSEW